MKKSEFINKIKKLIKEIYRDQQKISHSVKEFDILIKNPELKKVIVKLLTADFHYFLSSIDWVAPRPSTFRVNLKNNQEFYLVFNKKSWVAQIEGKKYYLLNLPEEERAVEALSKILKYGEVNPEGEFEDEGGFKDEGPDFGGDNDGIEEPIEEI